MRNLIPVICLFMLLTTGCNRQSGTPSPLIHPLTMGYVPDMALLPYWIADATDLYDSLGMDLHLVRFSSDPELYQAFKSGETDVMIADLPDAISLAAQGVPLKILTRNSSRYYLLSNPEETVTSPEELPGKNMAYSHRKLQEYALDKLLQQHNIRKDELNLPVIENDFIRMEMLENNLIDATLLTGKEAATAQQNGSRIIESLTENELPARVTVVRADSLQRKSAEVKALLEGYNRAVQKIHRTLEAIPRELLYDAGITGDPAEPYLLPDYSTASPLTKEELTKIVGWMKEKEYLPAVFNEKQFTDTIIKKY